MKNAVLHTDRYFGSAEIDRRIYGSFAEHMGRLIYGGLYQPGQKTADADGLRHDTLDLVREQGVTAVRYPGGNFVSAYRWEDTVGDPAKRPMRTEPAWRNMEPNTFGLNEFMKWCRLCDIEPVMAVNLGTRGADAARSLLEYCNLPAGSLYPDMRVSHGVSKPYGIKTWCLGNEMDGVWQIGHKSAEEYASLAAQAGRLMKKVDPSIELVACGSAGASLATFCDWDARILEQLYDPADYISVHAYYDNKNKNERDSAVFLGASRAFAEQLDSVIATCDYVRAKQKKKKRINLSVDEWNVVYRPHGKVPADAEWTVAPHQLEDIYNLEDALLVASLMFELLRRADRVKIACQAQLCNVISPIMTSDDAAWRQTTFFPFSQLSRYGRGSVLPLVCDTEKYEAGIYGNVPYIDALLTEGAERETLSLFVVSRDLNEDTRITLDLRQFEGYEVEFHSVLNSSGLRDVNSESAQDTVVPQNRGDAKIEGGILTATAEKHSFNTILLKKKTK